MEDSYSEQLTEKYSCLEWNVVVVIVVVVAVADLILVVKK